MQLLFQCLVFCMLCIGLMSGRTILEGEPGNRVPRQVAGLQRGYKDICRVVHSNGFSNPGNVPRCPY